MLLIKVKTLQTDYSLNSELLLLWSRAFVAHTKSNPTSRRAITSTLNVGLSSEYRYHCVKTSRMFATGSRSIGLWSNASTSCDEISSSTASGKTSLLIFNAMAANSRLLTLRSRYSSGISSGEKKICNTFKHAAYWS